MADRQVSEPVKRGCGCAHPQEREREKANYRPISLLSCLGKLMAKLVNSRLLNYLESNQLISRIQTGYSERNRNTEDQLVLLAQEIENAFQEKKKVLTVFVDLSKAFNKVWKKGLLSPQPVPENCLCKAGGEI